MKFVSLCCMFLLGIFVLASSAGTSIQREDPSKVSERLVMSLLKGDSSTIFKYLRPADVEKLHLTKANVRKVLDQLVFPTTEKVHPTQAPRRNASELPLTGMVVQQGIGPNRTKVFFEVTTYPEQHGPRATLKNFIEIAWLLQDAYSKRIFPVGIASSEAVLRGLKRDRPRLEALGVKSFLNETPSAEIETFSSMQKNLELSIGRAKRSMRLRRLRAKPIQRTRID